ncbi:MAG: hypothetical protein WCC58_10270 [Burkholderiales bacterium]
MADFDSMEIQRPQLARTYLQLLDAQPGRPLALFARRRVGKTFFLDRDLTLAAKQAGWVPVYADVWLHKTAPLDAINHALEEALDDATVPAGAVGKAAKTPVKKLGGFGASIEFGDEPKRRALPMQAELRFDALISRLAAQTGMRVLLMLDEIQALADVPNGEAILATLRAVLQKRKREAAAVFTGSSQDALALMVVASGGPLYQFAQLMDFPVLDDSYLVLLANHFARVHKGKKLNLDDLRRVFAHIGYKPALMKDLVKSMSAEGITDVDLALKHFAADERQVAGWRALLAAMSPLEKTLLGLIAQGKPPLGKETLAALPPNDGTNPTIAKVRVAIERLRRTGMLSKSAHGGYAIEDSLFEDYVKTLPLGKSRTHERQRSK